MGRTMIFALAAALLAGCAFERHYAIVPGKDQVVQVESGDRWLFELDENPAAGCEWDCTCDDDDVEVTIEHVAGAGGEGVAGKAKVTIRVHRGYDGPSTVTFFLRRRGEGPRPAKSFVITLFRRTGDEAFWK